MHIASAASLWELAGQRSTELPPFYFLRSFCSLRARSVRPLLGYVEISPGGDAHDSSVIAPLMAVTGAWHEVDVG